MSIQSNNNKRSEEYASSLLPNALCDGRVAVNEPSHVEYIGVRIELN